MDGKIRLVAVQLSLKDGDVASIDRFESKISRTFRNLSSEISLDPNTLVGLPEHIGTFLYFAYLARGSGAGYLSTLMRSFVARFPKILPTMLRYKVHPLKALLIDLGPEVLEEYGRIFSGISSRHGCYVVAGSIVEPVSDREVLNVSYLYDPSGEALLKQAKVHLVDFEKRNLRLSGGRLEDIDVVDARIGRIGIAVCYDAFFDDVMGRLDELGAEMVVQPSANPEVWDERLEREWPTGCPGHIAGASGLKYCVNPMLVGDVLGLHFEGRSSISAKVEEGFRYLSRAADPRGEMALYAEIRDDNTVITSEVQI